MPLDDTDHLSRERPKEKTEEEEECFVGLISISRPPPPHPTRIDFTFAKRGRKQASVEPPRICLLNLCFLNEPSSRGASDKHLRLLACVRVCVFDLIGSCTFRLVKLSLQERGLFQ